MFRVLLLIFILSNVSHSMADIPWVEQSIDCRSYEQNLLEYVHQLPISDADLSLEESLDIPIVIEFSCIGKFKNCDFGFCKKISQASGKDRLNFLSFLKEYEQLSGNFKQEPDKSKIEDGQKQTIDDESFEPEELTPEQVALNKLQEVYYASRRQQILKIKQAIVQEKKYSLNWTKFGIPDELEAIRITQEKLLKTREEKFKLSMKKALGQISLPGLSFDFQSSLEDVSQYFSAPKESELANPEAHEKQKKPPLRTPNYDSPSKHLDEAGAGL